MDEVKCPFCGRKPKPASVWKVCPRFDGDIVCINCCRSCKYYFFNYLGPNHVVAGTSHGLLLCISFLERDTEVAPCPAEFNGLGGSGRIFLDK